MTSTTLAADPSVDTRVMTSTTERAAPSVDPRVITSITLERDSSAGTRVMGGNRVMMGNVLGAPPANNDRMPGNNS